MKVTSKTVFVNCKDFSFDLDGSSEEMEWPFQLIHGLFKIKSTFWIGKNSSQTHHIVLYPGASALFITKENLELYLSNNIIPGANWYCPSCGNYWKKRAAKEEPPVKCPQCQAFLSKYERPEIDLFEIEQRITDGLEGKDGIKVIHEKERRNV